MLRIHVSLFKSVNGFRLRSNPLTEDTEVLEKS